MLDTIVKRGNKSDEDIESHLCSAQEDGGIMETMSIEVVTSLRLPASTEPRSPAQTTWHRRAQAGMRIVLYRLILN